MTMNIDTGREYKYITQPGNVRVENSLLINCENHCSFPQLNNWLL